MPPAAKAGGAERSAAAEGFDARYVRPSQFYLLGVSTCFAASITVIFPSLPWYKQ
jgi:hypothetical protein